MRHEEVATVLESRSLMDGVVESVGADRLNVRLDGEMVEVRRTLESAEAAAASLRPGDRVLVAIPGGDRERACLVGVIVAFGEARVGAGGPEAERRLAARRIVVEAGERLELRVGESRIVITEDGRVLIQGTSLLSRARALNRIKGAAVQIN